MADTLKFGPEWLRALSDGNSSGGVTSPPPSPGFPKYKLAEHRYGREEMLALYHPSKFIPESLKGFPSILLEKPQNPVVLLPLSEEEQRMMSSSVNSSAVLRLMGRGSSSGPPATRGSRGGGGGERGRGRGRGRGEPGFYGRGGPQEEGESGFGRGRTFQRSESWDEGDREKRFDRPYQGRASMEETTDITSPRKDLSRSMSTENWRDARDKEKEKSEKPAQDTSPSNSGNGNDVEQDEGGDWRRAGPKGHDKWGRGSWRDRQYESERGQDGFIDRGYRRHNSQSWQDEDDLPEWSTADADEELGTFDSSGAFMSSKDLRRSSDKKAFRRDKDEADEDDEEQPEWMDDYEEDGDPLEPEEPVKKPVPEKSNLNNVSEKNLKNNAPPVSRNRNNHDSKNAELQPSEIGSHGPDKNVPREIDSIHKDSDPVPPKGLSVKDEEPFDHLELAAENLVDSLTADYDDDEVEEIEHQHPQNESKNNGDKGPWDHQDSQKWFYRDPQGELQGPFGSSEMAEWFSAGYFTMNLLVKRGCDEEFQPLGEVIKCWGRVPFLPGPPPAVMNAQPSSSVEDTAPSQSPQNVPIATSVQSQMIQGAVPAIPSQYLLHQQIMQQQYLRSLALLQANEKTASLPLAQQQQLAVQLLLKQQQDQLLQQLAASQKSTSPSSTPTSEIGNPPQLNFVNSLPQQATPQMQQPSQVPDMLQQMWAQVAAAQQQQQQLQNSQPNQGGNVGNNIWDIDQSKVQTLKDLESMQKEQDLKQDMERKKVDEERLKQESEMRQEEIRRQELERQRLVELERERQRQLEMQKQQQAQEEDRRRMEEEKRRQEEMEMQRQQELQRLEMERKRQQEMERQRQEMERQRQIEIEQQQQRHKVEMERLAELERRRQEEERQKIEEMQRQQIEMERQRQQEIQRRQFETPDHHSLSMLQELQRHQEMQRQQQEAIRRLQSQQELSGIQLPASAQWGTQNNKQQQNSSLSMAEIQKLQEEREAKEREEQQQQMELQRLQMQAVQQAQQQTPPRGWGQAGSKSAKSLMEIQQEQAAQEQRAEQHRVQNRPAPNLPLASAAVWGNSGGNNISSRWAQEGAWGNASKQQMGGFWDDTITKNKKNSGVSQNSDFPTLKPVTQNSANHHQSNKSKTSKALKEEETVQRLFQAHKVPADEFSKWCETTLRNMRTSVDIPTFIAFLMEVDSPYEVHDYVRSYLGETKESTVFAKQFLERRSKHRNNSRVEHEDSLWGPTPALNPNLNKQTVSNNNTTESTKSKKAKKNKMQKIDNSVLGFTVHASEDRINVGDIDTPLF